MAYRITALQLQKRNHQRVNVYLDGEFAFGLARIVAAWLYVGQEIDDERIARLKAEDAHEVAYQQAVNLLNHRARAETEIRRNLERHGYTAEVIQSVMERLERSGLTNDSRFAGQWVENRSSLRPRSRRALQYELQRHGVDRQTIEQSLEGLDDEALAHQAAGQQARKYREMEWPDFRKKMLSFLARRGFAYEASATAAARAWAELHNTEPDDDDMQNE